MWARCDNAPVTSQETLPEDVAALRALVLTAWAERDVNAGEKMHRRAGVKMHHGRRRCKATANSAFQFDR